LTILQKIGRQIPQIRQLRDALFERDALASQLSALGREAAEMRAAREEHRLIVTDYPYHPRRRPIDKTAGGMQLIERLKAEEGQYSAVLRGIAKHSDLLRRIPRDERDSMTPFWSNDWFPPFDGAALYGLIAERAPERYIEVGSGNSTRFARQAIRDLGLRTRIVSIDPMPRIEIDALCDETVRSPMEDVPTEFWESLGPNDLLFIDNSHRSFPNSDVTVFFTEIMPALKPGVTWGLHDIFLPFDYPQEWSNRFYNEQYLLLTYLLGGAQHDEIVLPVMWATDHAPLHGILEPLWKHEDLFPSGGTRGGSFWMRKRDVRTNLDK
jgi:hypothetical protein